VSVPYLQELTLRLALGAAHLDPAIRTKHADWLRSQQRHDGGFAGREGESDPYYTAFALRALWILDAIDEPLGRRAGGFLRTRLGKKESIIDLISLIFAAAICELAAGEIVIGDDDLAWRKNVADLLASLRTDDGGFAKTPEGRAGSTYQTFLSAQSGRHRIFPEIATAPRGRLSGNPGRQTRRRQPDRGSHRYAQSTRASGSR
jgi:geranylgeranyl transferase type-2 subunit beta